LDIYQFYHSSSPPIPLLSMPRSGPHPAALFSLIPRNDRAKAVVEHPSNSHLVWMSPAGVLGINIGFNVPSDSSNVLATLGRHNTNIYMEGRGISKLQCSFEIDPDTGVVMLYDRSTEHTTQVSGPVTFPFEHGRVPRKILVQKDLNILVGMGGKRCNLVEFELRWHQDSSKTEEKIKNHIADPNRQVNDPAVDRTVTDEDEAATEVPSGRLTRIHTTGIRSQKMRYVPLHPRLGSGQFGVVYKAIDVDTGKVMAVKILKEPRGRSRAEKQQWEEAMTYAKREVEAIRRVDHVSSADFLSSYPCLLSYHHLPSCRHLPSWHRFLSYNRLPSCRHCCVHKN
jgi:hypothetical protein